MDGKSHQTALSTERGFNLGDRCRQELAVADHADTPGPFADQRPPIG